MREGGTESGTEEIREEERGTERERVNERGDQRWKDGMRKRNTSEKERGKEVIRLSIRVRKMECEGKEGVLGIFEKR